MQNCKKKHIPANRVFLCLVSMLAISSVSVGDYLKMNPPPDIDKVEYNFSNGKSCWVAAGSNVLAGAGYGDGNNVQERADDIYRELCGNLVDCNNGGWEDTAITKWLNSKYNNCPNNPYKAVNVYGRDTNRPPYARADLPQVIGNDLRKCNFVTLGINHPNWTSGHAVTCWGDNGADANKIDSNPTEVKITDSDYWDFTQILQTYTYDDYNNPSPNNHDCNDGNGWYIDYYKNDNCHWYIDGFVTFEPSKNFLGSFASTLVASDQFTYPNDPQSGGFLLYTSLHYKISSNYPILSYRTSVNWDTNIPPSFFEDTNYVYVSWDFSNHWVPQGTTVTATAEIIVPHYDIGPGSTITIDNIGWEPVLVPAPPGGGWWGQNSILPGGSSINAPNICGGYVVCACTLYAGPSGPPVGEYRGQLQYDYYEDPCNHVITFQPETVQGTYFMGNFRFGHSYGLLMDDELPQFNNWKTIEYPYPPYQTLGPRTFVLDWTGQLPYPRGQDYVAPKKCGDPGTFFYGGDINKDCKVDLDDFALLAADWLKCTDPNQANCP